jgi:hypothetical protein
MEEVEMEDCIVGLSFFPIRPVAGLGGARSARVVRMDKPPDLLAILGGRCPKTTSLARI